MMYNMSADNSNLDFTECVSVIWISVHIDLHVIDLNLQIRRFKGRLVTKN